MIEREIIKKIVLFYLDGKNKKGSDLAGKFADVIKSDRLNDILNQIDLKIDKRPSKWRLLSKRNEVVADN